MLAKNGRPQFLHSYHGRTGGFLVKLGSSMTFVLSRCGHVIGVLTVTSWEGAMLIDGHAERPAPCAYTLVRTHYPLRFAQR